MVPEYVLKRNKGADERTLAEKITLEVYKKNNYGNRKLNYEEDYLELIKLKHEANIKGGFGINHETKLLFIIRIRGINAMDPKTKTISRIREHYGFLLFAFLHIFNSVFLKVNKATLQMLQRVETLPNIETVKELIYKSGYGKLSKRRTALTNNFIVEHGLFKGMHLRRCVCFLFKLQVFLPLRCSFLLLVIAHEYSFELFLVKFHNE
ncbi:hypothetical protein MKW98_003717 [Papaver atlanticum]|uniref:Uncharacterized protein n=1 Tax=Papaver atlanticum TaxID=357466 RepID=A0AAD4SIW4_9MAGN|nr:hypothetical protein MKW98_003717 [Papaver atlanticum]